MRRAAIVGIVAACLSVGGYTISRAGADGDSSTNSTPTVPVGTYEVIPPPPLSGRPLGANPR